MKKNSVKTKLDTPNAKSAFVLDRYIIENITAYTIKSNRQVMYGTANSLYNVGSG